MTIESTGTTNEADPGPFTDDELGAIVAAVYLGGRVPLATTGRLAFEVQDLRAKVARVEALAGEWAGLVNFLSGAGEHQAASHVLDCRDSIRAALADPVEQHDDGEQVVPDLLAALAGSVERARQARRHVSAGNGP